MQRPRAIITTLLSLRGRVILGFQAFWHGFFFERLPYSDYRFTFIHPSPPPIHRIIFGYTNGGGWRDDPGFNSYFLRGTLPSVTVEHDEDWNDKISITRSNTRAYHFPLLILVDRSASFRGTICGSRTQRTASEAWNNMRNRGKLRDLYIIGWYIMISGRLLRVRQISKQSNPSSILLLS
jgi:hypothetical protein